MMMELYEQGIKVGYVVEDPYDYEYSGMIPAVDELLSSKPMLTKGITDPDNPNADGSEVVSGEEWYTVLGSQLQNLGVWRTELVNG